MKQLHDCNICQPVAASTLSASQQWSTLGYLMFQEQKQTHQIKWSGCADRQEQQILDQQGGNTLTNKCY